MRRAVRWTARAGLLAAALAGPGAAFAAEEVEVRAFLQPRRVTDADSVQLVIEVEGSELAEVSVPRLPALENLELVGGPSTSRSSVVQMGGGRTLQRLTFRLVYVLMPEGPGPAEVPPIEVRVGEQVHRTEPIRVEVERGSTPRGAPPAAGPPRSSGGSEDLPVFIEARMASREVWVGQPVELDLTLFAAVPVTGMTFVEEPSFANFWVEDDPPDSRAEAYRTTVSGRLYNAYPVVRKVLVPATPGEFHLEPYAARIEVSRSTGDMLRDFFSGARSQAVIRRTPRLALRVKALPEAGRPADFGGAVGSFRLKTEVDRERSRANDAVSLKATVEGEGFLGSLPAPHLGAPPDLKVFEPKVTGSSEIRQGKLRSRRTWEWVLVPLTPGEMRLPAPTLSYFDPASGRYAELRGPERTLVVERAETGEGEIAAARSEVRPQRSDIQFIKRLKGSLSDRAPGVHRRPWFLALAVLPLVLAPAAILAGRRRARYLTDRGFARARRARSRSRKRLRAARSHLARVEPGAFHEEVARALVEYLADRFDRSASGLTYVVVDDLLASRSVDAELRRRVRSCLETCDFARYVAGSADSGRRAEVLREAEELVERLEKVLA